MHRRVHSNATPVSPIHSERSSTHPRKPSSISAVEHGRGDLHTLQEDHGHLLSSSLDAAFQDMGGMVPSSSQFGGFALDDNFFEAVDLGGDIGDELARELGEGWSISQKQDM